VAALEATNAADMALTDRVLCSVNRNLLIRCQMR